MKFIHSVSQLFFHGPAPRMKFISVKSYEYSSVISRSSPSHYEFEVHSPSATLLAYGHSVCRLRLSRMLLSASCRTSF